MENGRKIDIGLSIEASEYLKDLVLQPNPNLAECAFLGLGKENQVDQILSTPEISLSYEPGLTKKGNMLVSSVSNGQLILLFIKLGDIQRNNDVLVFGHLHPSGAKAFGTEIYYVPPSQSLLEPSMGSTNEGGPTKGGDIAFLKDRLKGNPNFFPYVGIAAVTRTGPKLRLYLADKLIKIKRYNDIDKVPQTTIDL